jgi:hypothetical protein
MDRVTPWGGPSEEVSALPLNPDGAKASKRSAGNSTEQQRSIIPISEAVRFNTKLALPEANSPEQGSHLGDEVSQGSLGAPKWLMKNNLINRRIRGRSADQEDSVLNHQGEQGAEIKGQPTWNLSWY